MKQYLNEHGLELLVNNLKQSGGSGAGIGDLSRLQTTDKTDLVSAINEICNSIFDYKSVLDITTWQVAYDYPLHGWYTPVIAADGTLVTSNQGYLDGPTSPFTCVIYSTDNGKTWHESNMKAIGYCAKPVLLSDGTLFIGGARAAATDNDPDDDSTYAYSSTDNGKTWTKLSLYQDSPKNIFNKDILEASDGTLVTVGSAFGIWYSQDKGLSWSIASVPKNTNGKFSMPNKLSNGVLLIHAIDHEVWRSTDNGVTWEPTNIINGGWGPPVELSDGTVILPDALRHGIWYSTDNGVTWEASNITTDHWYNTPVELSNGTVIICTSEDSEEHHGIWYSTDHGKTWQQSNITDGVWTKPVELSNGMVLIPGNYTEVNTILRSTTGTEWEHNNNLPDSSSIIYGSSLFEVSQNMVILIRNEADIIYSVDNGETWRTARKLGKGDKFDNPIKTPNGSVLVGARNTTTSLYISPINNKAVPKWEKE